MRKVEIGNGVALTEIALGATGMGAPEKEAERFAIMDRYVELGGNCFDTARMYAGGQSDVVLGKWLRKTGMRDRVLICAKGCHPTDVKAMHVSRLTPADIEGDLDRSLDAMGTDHADLYLLHRDNPKLPVAEIMETMHALVQAGKTRVVGASNWTVGRITEANAYARANGLTPFAVSQVFYSLAVTTPAQTQDVTHVMMNDIEAGGYRASQLPVMGFGTQARGYFAREIAGVPQKPGPHQYYDFLPENHARAMRVKALSEARGWPVSAILAAYVRDSDLNTIALCGCSSVAQLEEIWQADGFRLPQADRAYLETGLPRV